MDILLIPGMWLDGSAWGAVVDALVPYGHRGVALTLPGQGDGSTATLDDQVAAVVAAVDAVDGRPLVVGHSAASTLAWIAADARPDKVGRVVMVGGFPSSDGDSYFPVFEPEGGFVGFPGWDAFEGPDSADLDKAARERISARTVPVPAAVTHGVVRLHDARRFEVPVAVVCPEFSPAQAREWVAGGQIPELSHAHQVDYLDIDSGHWPMFSRPNELARLLAGLADG